LLYINTRFLFTLSCMFVCCVFIVRLFYLNFLSSFFFLKIMNYIISKKKDFTKFEYSLDYEPIIYWN